MIDSWKAASEWYLAASRDEKIHWLSLLVFYVTMFGRGTYEPETENLEDPIAMRRLNEFVHSISSNILDLIDDSHHRFADHVFLEFLSEAASENNFKWGFCLQQMMHQVGNRSSIRAAIGRRSVAKRYLGRTKMDHWEAAKEWYLAASRNERIRWLSLLVFYVTMFGRGTYEPGTEDVEDPVAMRRINEFVHRLSSHLLDLIDDGQHRFADHVFLEFLSEAASEVKFRWESYLPHMMRRV